MSLSLQTEKDFKSHILSASRQGKIIATVPFNQNWPLLDNDIRSVRWLGNGTIHFGGRERFLRNLGKGLAWTVAVGLLPAVPMFVFSLSGNIFSAAGEAAATSGGPGYPASLAAKLMLIAVFVSVLLSLYFHHPRTEKFHGIPNEVGEALALGASSSPQEARSALATLEDRDRADDVRGHAAGILYEMYLAGFEELSRDEAALKSIRYRKDELYREQWGMK